MSLSVMEIVFGVVLIFASIAIILMVLFQDTKGNGLSGAIGGGEMMMGESRMRSNTAVLVKYTKYAGIVFFVCTLLVGVFGVIF